MSTRENEMKMLRLTARYLKENNPENCKDYRKFAQEPLFRGMCYGLERFGITSEDIEQDICEHVLKIQRPKPLTGDGEKHAVRKTNLNGLYGKIARPVPEDIAKMQPEAKIKFIQMWVEYELGILEGTKRKFDETFCATMKATNDKCMEYSKTHD